MFTFRRTRSLTKIAREQECYGLSILERLRNPLSGRRVKTMRCISSDHTSITAPAGDMSEKSARHSGEKHLQREVWGSEDWPEGVNFGLFQNLLNEGIVPTAKLLS